MLVTSVKIELAESRHPENRLRAYAQIVLDGSLAIRDIKVIDGRTQGLFIAMPCRKITDRCPACGGKNQLSARFCGSCGAKLNDDRAVHDPDGNPRLDISGRPRIHADVAFPINHETRRLIHDAVVAAYLATRTDQPAVA